MSPSLHSTFPTLPLRPYPAVMKIPDTKSGENFQKFEPIKDEVLEVVIRFVG